MVLKNYLIQFQTFVSKMHPAKQLALGYLFYIAIGWLLLCLPIAHQTTALHPLDHLFTTTSAISTTGLTTISTSDSYNFFGELIVLVLIQLGGLGYMTVGSFLILSRTSELPPLRAVIGRVALGIPSSFEVNHFMRNVLRFTLWIEGIGALFLYGIFRGNGGGVLHSLWSAIFHSISAFCTAGFGLHNNSFESFVDNVEVNIVLAVLSYLGAIGFIVCVDVWEVVNLRKKSLTLTSKVIVWFTAGLTVVGAFLLFFFEPALPSGPTDQRMLPAFFQTMAALTTVGFDTFSIAQLSKASILILTILMIIGASPGGTGGGLKSTSFAAIFGVMASLLRGKREVRFWGEIVPTATILTAVAGLGAYLSCLVIGTYLLELTQSGAPFEQNLFEAASALGTVGLSMGITSSLTAAGKWIVILLMFCGRLNPVTFGLALFEEGPAEPPEPETETELVL